MSPAFAAEPTPTGVGSLVSDIRASGREAQQLAVFVALSRVKREIRALFEAHPTLRDLLPTRVVREEHIATDEYVNALERVRARIVTLRRRSLDLESKVDALILRARACQESSENKRTFKEEAVAFLRTDASAIFTEHFSRVRRSVRTTHVASEILVGALVAVEGSALSPTVKATARELARKIAPLRVKTALKGEINAFLEQPELGDLRVRKAMRADHAPLVELIARLESVKRDLAAFRPTTGETDTMTRLDQLVAGLGERKQGKRRRDELVAKIRKIESDIPKIKAGVSGFEHRLEGERSRQQGLRATAARELAALETRMEEEQATRDRAQVGVEDLLEALELLGDFRAPDGWGLDDGNKSRADCVKVLEGLRKAVPTIGDVSEPPPGLQLQILGTAIEAVRTSPGPAVEAPVQDWVDVAQARLETDRKADLAGARKRLAEADARIAVLRAQEETLCAQVDAADQALDEIATLVDFCAKQKEEIKKAKDECRTFWQNYQNTQALVFYFGLNDNIQDCLMALGRFVKGYNDRVDALGRIEVVLVFDAGVRAGVDIGFVALNASVQLTLVLSGALEVLDSRQMGFEYRLALYVTVGAKASLGKPSPDEAGVDADIQKPPQVLIDLAAQCRCNLWDCTGFIVYGSERTWAAHWSHNIARRIAFLRAVQVKDKGGEAINEEWVDAQVERLLAEPECTGAGGSTPVSWRKMLEARKELLAELAATRPRLFTMKRVDRVDAEAHVTVVGRTASLGTESRHRAEYAFSETREGREHPLGSLAEDACTFEFAGKEAAKGAEASAAEKAPEARTVTNLAAAGHCVYHEWTPSEGRVAAPRGHDPGPRRYLEVFVSDAQRVGQVETWSFEMAGTISETLTSSRELRALAAALEHTPPDAESPRITLPGRLAGEADELAQLAAACQQRAELVMSQGELAPLKRRLLAFEERRKKVEKRVDSLHKAATTIEETAGKVHPGSGPPVSAPGPLGGFDKTIADVRAQVSPVAELLGGEAAQARAVLDVAKEHLDAVGTEIKSWLKNTAAVSLRWTSSWRCHLGEGGALGWRRVWVPQVYRGMQVRDFKVAVSHTVPIVPCVSAFFGFELRVRRRNAAFEVLGLGTFSYVKSLWHGLGQAAVGARAGSGTPWDEFLALHRQELHDLCEQVAQPGSSAFSEVVIDALTSKRTAAKAFGRACWEHFNPDHKNPFDDLTEDAVVGALQGVPKPGRRRPAAPTLQLSALPVVPGPIAVPAVPVSHLEAARINPEYLGRVEALLRGDVRAQVIEAFATCRGALERVVVLKQLATKISGEHTPAPFELRSEREAEGIERLAKVLEQARAHHALVEAELVALRSKSDDLVGKAAGLHGLALREAAVFEALEGDLRALAERIGLPPAGALAGSVPPFGNAEIPAKLLDDMFVAAASAAQVRLVPSLGNWQVQSRVSWVIRSAATKKLDNDLQQYDAALARLSPPGPRDGAPIGGQLDRLAAALQTRAAETRKLLAAIEAWRGGKDENDSNRAPRVGWFLEVPTQRQLITQQLCRTQLRLRQHLVGCLRLGDELGSALHAHDLRMGGERDRRAQIEADEAKRRRLEAERSDALGARTGQIANFMRERALRTRQVVDEAKRRLLAKVRFPEAELTSYLREGAADFAVDALLHGQKKR